MPTFSQDFFLNIGVLIAGVILIIRKVKQVLVEVKPNGGSSLADSVKRIESSLISSTQWNVIFQNLYNEPMYKSDKNGNCIWINNAYIHLVGAGLEDLKDKRWLSIVHDEDRERVRTESASALADRRTFDSIFRVKNFYNGKIFKVRSVAHPNVTSESLQGYLGSMHVLEEIRT
jgi:PAS domain S-box-containing protein